MARRRRRRRRAERISSYGFDATPIGLVLFAVALAVRLLLAAEGFVFETSVRVARAVETAQYTWPLGGPDTPSDVAFRSGLVLVGRGLDALARDWTAAASSEGTLIAAGAIAGALLTGAVVWLAALVGFDRWRAALAGFALALSPLHVGTSAAGDLSSLALVVAAIAVGLSVVAAQQRSVPAAAVSGLVLGIALAASASSVAALVACVVSLLLASARRRWLLMAFAVTAASGIAAALPGGLMMLRDALASGRYTGPATALGSIAGAVTPVGAVLLLAGAGAMCTSRARAPIVAWLLAALAMHTPTDPELAALWSAPGAIVLAAAAFETRRRILVPVVALVVVWGFVRGFETIAYRHDRVGPERVAARVAEISPATAVVVSAEPDYVAYYADRAVRAWPPRPIPPGRTAAENAEALAIELHRLAAGGRAVYVLRSTFLAPEGAILEEEIRAWFDVEPVERMETETVRRRPLDLARIDEVVYALAPREAP